MPGNDKIYQGVDGTWYYVQCCTDAAGAVVKEVVRTGSHKECVDKCSAHRDCQRYVYVPLPFAGSLDRRLLSPDGQRLV